MSFKQTFLRTYARLYNPSMCDMFTGYQGENINNSVTAYAYHLSQWVSANCNYFYYPSKTFF